MQPPFAQSAFGLVLHGDEPVPGLAPAPPGAEAPVRLRLRRMPAWLAAAEPGAAEWLAARRNRDPARPGPAVRLVVSRWFLMDYPDGTRFLLDRGASVVWATWSADATLEDTATYLLGPVLGFVLRLRGVLALHASVVALGGRAIALVGPGGAGKSTAAAAFACAGHAVLADDVAALDECGGGFSARPAYPRLRLWDDSARSLFGEGDPLPLLTPNWEKRYLDLASAGRFHAAPLPLAALYLLGARDEAGPRVEPVAPAAALVELVANTYAGTLLDAGMRRREFDALSRLVRAVPVRRLHPHPSADRLPALAAAVERDAGALAATAA